MRWKKWAGMDKKKEIRKKREVVEKERWERKEKKRGKKEKREVVEKKR